MGVWWLTSLMLLSAAPDAANAGSVDGLFAQAELTPWVSIPERGSGAGLLQLVGNVGYGIPIADQHRLSFALSYRPSLAAAAFPFSVTPASLTTTLQLRVGEGVITPNVALFTFIDPLIGVSPGFGYRIASGSWLFGANLNGDIALTPRIASDFSALGDGAWLDGRGLRWGARVSFSVEHFFDARWSLGFVASGRLAEHMHTANTGDDPRFPPFDFIELRGDARGRFVGTWAFHRFVGMSLSLGGGVMRNGTTAAFSGFGEAD